MNPSHFHRSRAGFTLLEILVSCALLAMLVVMLAAMVDGVNKVSGGETRKLNAAAQARTAFNQMGHDLAAITTGAGATLILGRSPGAAGLDDSMAFLTKARGCNNVTNHRFLAVFYAVRKYSDSVLRVSSDSLPILGRGFGSVPWQDTSGTINKKAILDSACAMAATEVNGSTDLISDRAVIADGVIRMVVVLQLKTGQLIPFDPSNPDFPELAGFIRSGISLPADARAVDLSKVSGILVGLAALDQRTRTAAAATLASLPDKLPRPAAGQTPLQAWDFNDSTFAASFNDVPAPVRQSLRFFQRTFPVQVP